MHVGGYIFVWLLICALCGEVRASEDYVWQGVSSRLTLDVRGLSTWSARNGVRG